MKKIRRNFLINLGFEESYVSPTESGDLIGFTYWYMKIIDEKNENNYIELVSSEIDDDDLNLNTTDITISLLESNAAKCIYENELLTLIEILKRF